MEMKLGYTLETRGLKDMTDDIFDYISIPYNYVDCGVPDS